VLIQSTILPKGDLAKPDTWEQVCVCVCVGLCVEHYGLEQSLN